MCFKLYLDFPLLSAHGASRIEKRAGRGSTPYRDGARQVRMGGNNEHSVSCSGEVEQEQRAAAVRRGDLVTKSKASSRLWRPIIEQKEKLISLNSQS